MMHQIFSLFLVSLVYLCVSIHCSPLVPSTLTNYLDTSTNGLTTIEQPSIKNAFAFILSSTSVVTDITGTCKSTLEELGASKVRQNVALTQMLISELVSYNQTTENENFNVLVFVDDTISQHQRRRLQQAGANVRYIKAIQAYSQQCPMEPLKCNDIPTSGDFIRSSEDMNMSEYDKIVLLDVDVLPSHRFSNVFSDLRAQPLLSKHHSAATERKVKNTAASINTPSQAPGPSTRWNLSWFQHLFRAGNELKRTNQPIEIFPHRDSMILRKPAMEMFDHYITMGEVLFEEYTMWEVCVA